MKTNFQPDEIPYFSWDRSLTVRQIKELLQSAAAPERCRLAAWIMREAAVADVWQFLTPQEVWGQFDKLAPWLGRRQAFWRYILSTWHELGKV